MCNMIYSLVVSIKFEYFHGNIQFVPMIWIFFISITKHNKIVLNIYLGTPRAYELVIIIRYAQTVIRDFQCDS